MDSNSCTDFLEYYLAEDLDNGLYDMQHNFYIAEASIFEGRGFKFTGYDNVFSIQLFGCRQTEINIEAMNLVLREGFRLGVLASASLESLFLNIRECPR